MQNLNNQVESVERFDSFMRKDARIVDKSIPTEYEESRSYRVLYRCAFSLTTPWMRILPQDPTRASAKSISITPHSRVP
jgi:hypothetical protein